MANVIVPKNKGTQKLFQNPVLEKLTRTHIAVPLTIFSVFSLALVGLECNPYIPFRRHNDRAVFIGIYSFYLGGVRGASLCFPYENLYQPPGLRFQYIVHGVHHEYPKDKDRLAMPPLLSVTIINYFIVVIQSW